MRGCLHSAASVFTIVTRENAVAENVESVTPVNVQLMTLTPSLSSNPPMLETLYAPSIQIL